MVNKIKPMLVACILLFCGHNLSAQGIMQEEKPELSKAIAVQPCLANIPGRSTVSLNGKWQAIIDPYDFGNGERAIWKDKKATGKTDFYEYSFDGGPVLNVPGDFNSQRP